MKGDSEVLGLLNEALVAEMTASHQYFTHSKYCQDWGFFKLAEHYQHESEEEMGHANKLMDRILLLGGTPDLAALGPVLTHNCIKEQFEADLKIEGASVELYRRASAVCITKGDPGSRVLFEELVLVEEEHYDWIDTQLSLIDQIGLERYKKAQLGGLTDEEHDH